MSEDKVVRLSGPGLSVETDPLLSILRDGAQRMLISAVEAEVESFSDGGHQQSLGQAGNTHQQGVTTSEKGDSEFLDHIFLADDDLADLFLELSVDLAELIDGGDVIGGQGHFRRNRLLGSGGFSRLDGGSVGGGFRRVIGRGFCC